MQITIDNGSGFCFGVDRAVEIAERELKEHELLYCLGDIVHNEMEVNRLKSKGLVIIGHEELKNLKDCKVLIRAHGEPPETYRIALQNNIRLIDASCTIVMNLQKDIRAGFNGIRQKNGQIVIYGKKGHPEVNGLVGQAGGKAIVVAGEENLNEIDFTRPVMLYAQTTKSVDGFQNIVKRISEKMTEANPGSEPDLIWKDTVCRQVANRTDQLKEFAAQFDVVLFVSGRKSSNGLALFQVCKDVNPLTYLVSEAAELKTEWFNGHATVGICGATSTPMWLMEEVGKAVQSI